jgi:hypothetical protein
MIGVPLNDTAVEVLQGELGRHLDIASDLIPPRTRTEGAQAPSGGPRPTGRRKRVSEGRTICCAIRLRSRPAWGVITTLSAVAAPDNAHPQLAQGHPMPATRSARKGPHQGAG